MHGRPPRPGDQSSRPRLRTLGPDAMADRLFGILRHQTLQFGLGLFMFEVRRRVRENTAANSAQALDVLMSTMRIASMRGFGGSTPNSRGVSPLSTQRQNFRSAVTMRSGRAGPHER